MATVLIGNLEANDLRQSLPRHATKQPPSRAMEQIIGVAIHNVGPPVHREFTSTELARYHVEHHDWPCIAYSLVSHWDGSIDYTLDWPEVGWHVGGQNNWRYLGICLTGWFDDERVPTARQLVATRDLIANLEYAFGRRLEVRPHFEIGSEPTACPGSTWTMWRGRLVAPPAETPPADAEVVTLRRRNAALEVELARYKAAVRHVRETVDGLEVAL